MKKKLIVIAVIMACVALVSAGTAAFFTEVSTAKNVITTGSVEIALHEITDQLDENGEPIPFEDIDGAMPGTSVSKIVYLENTGESDAWVRIRADKSIRLAGEGEADLSLITMDFNTEAWTEKDGYYYYNEKLAPGKTTEPLFTSVTFAAEMDNTYQSSTATVDVTAEAVQVANNGAAALEAAGWPEE